jgi:hypothetical protein
MQWSLNKEVHTLVLRKVPGTITHQVDGIN